MLGPFKLHDDPGPMFLKRIGAGGPGMRTLELRRKLKEIVDDLNDEQAEDPDGVPVSLLIGCYVPADSAPADR